MTSFTNLKAFPPLVYRLAEAEFTEFGDTILEWWLWFIAMCAFPSTSARLASSHLRSSSQLPLVLCAAAVLEKLRLPTCCGSAGGWQDFLVWLSVQLIHLFIPHLFLRRHGGQTDECWSPVQQLRPNAKWDKFTGITGLMYVLLRVSCHVVSRRDPLLLESRQRIHFLTFISFLHTLFYLFPTRESISK